MVDDNNLPALSDSRTSSPTTSDDSLANGMPNNGYDSIMDDNYPAATPVSPNSTTTVDGDPLALHQEQLRQHYKGFQRRPGLGVTAGEDFPRNPDGPPSVEKARAALGYDKEQSLQCELVPGESVHMVSMTFVEELCDWLDNTGTSVRPTMGPVDNTDLFEYFESLERPGRLREGLRMGEHYILVSPKVWDLLMDWFGGGPCITRKCVNINGRLGIDVRGIELKIKRSSRPTRFIRHLFSVYDTVGHMKRVVIDYWKATQLAPDDGVYRIWDYADERCHGRMHPESAQLASFRLRDGQSVMFEEADPMTGEFKWDPETGEDTTTSNSNTFAATSSSAFSTASSLYDVRRRRADNTVTSTRAPVVPGAVGLMNLGNTCFMNSTLQCLSNIWLLRDRFVNDDFEADVNTTNPLGTGGKLARSFGDLMKLIWGNRGDVVSPAGFKSVMAEFKPEFSGYQQHDSQELLSFLLDGLHEDLNRVKNKPITQPVEANGRSEEEVAAESCRVHRMRNDSFVNDLFEGFYKSTVICPDCRKVSVTFDPFTLVQLPVSRPKQTKLVSIPVAVVRAEDGLPFRSRPTYVQVPQEAYMYEVRNKACSNQATGVDPNDFIICSVIRDKIEKVFTDFDKVEKLNASEELCAFQDPNARQLRLIQELKTNGIWHRPMHFSSSNKESEIEDDNEFMNEALADEAEVNDMLAECQEDPECGAVVVPSLPKSFGKSTVPFACPFASGDVWIGSLENRKFRMRLQIVELCSYGPWLICMGYRIKGVVDVAPTPYLTVYEKREGIEEAAFEVIGYVRDPAILSEAAPINCIFQQGRFLGSYGTYIGDDPTLTPERTPFGLTGACASRDFFSGQVIEDHSSRRYSMYSQPKPVALIRWDKNVVPTDQIEDLRKLWREQSFAGPRRGHLQTALGIVTVLQIKGNYFDTVGQPAMMTVPADTNAKQLHDLLVQRFTRRIQSRAGQTAVLSAPGFDGEDLDPRRKMDPYGLLEVFKLTQRSPGETYARTLEAYDEDTLIFPNTDSALPTTMVTVEWDSAKLPYDGPFYDALFGNLYTEDGSDEDGKRLTSLYDCFDMFSEEERLTATETWYCSNCKDHKEAYKKMELWQLPPVLVVHFKRFSQSHMSYYVDKDDTEIDFPMEGLDLRDRVISAAGKEECIYDLVAVSHHYGGLGGGHYIAHARNENDGHWYEFDDSSVRLLGASSIAASRKVKGSSAYVLMYVKRHLVPPRWHAQPTHFFATETLDPADVADDVTADLGVV